jgi:CDP-diacylglycerol--glycerol-3-phosphate 3-phosphatidyltransferase
MKARDEAQRLIYVIIDPFVRLLVKVGFTPNIITTIGLIINVIACVVFIYGGEMGERGDLSYIGWGCFLVLFAGLFDILDGQVARIGNMSSRYGALYDSVLDRYSELLMFLGICYYLVSQDYLISSLFAFIALVGSMMVSYVRARAEGIGIECKGGLMQRPERIIIIGVSGLLCGIVYSVMGGSVKTIIWGVMIIETISIFTIPITVVAILSNITAIRRLLSSRKKLLNVR